MDALKLLAVVNATLRGKPELDLQLQFAKIVSDFGYRPGGLFNQKEKAKWDAWDKWSKDEELVEDSNKAKEKYCELVANIIPEADW